MTTEASHNSCLDIALPGYTLTEQLGAGGYGEVWRATAPGGLTKAVKFVFGHYSEKRAAHELKALEKIKEVRHPFLLSLERIEVLDDRLVIITEVADASLKDRFDKCVEDGLSGIPRDELLGYLRDTADALDFLSTQHSLQHLDVKPENLLLLAGHIKVADFGLVKEVHNTQASLVGGLTPLYASPEVFQGRPSAHSDQYSLAVVYQEMLTGSLPFVGASAAELTMQHLNDEPDLSSLPVADRYTLARALAKNVDQRFGSCGEFVEALLKGGSDWHRGAAAKPQAGRATESNGASKVATARAPRRGPVTEVFDEVLGGGGKPATPSILLEVPKQRKSAPTELPPINVDANDFQATPVLVIGIGGVGGNILCQMRRQIAKRFGDHADVPALKMLLLDSDPKGILAATSSSRDGSLRTDETMSLGLRRPQDYRDRSERLQQWLSRRWLYNIPKSLNTEGLRPLGRLALVDHAKQTLQRIRMAVSEAVDSDAVERSAANTGLGYQANAVRVYIAASISGGIGGGASLDLGYAVRTVLQKIGLENATIIGTFTHSTGVDQRSCELACVNAYSWLTEFRHATQPDFAYPGDAGAGLPSFPTGVAPFDHTYLLKLDDGLQPTEFEQAAERVAEYIYLDAMTPAQGFFDACRTENAADASSNCLRSFGVQRIVAASEQEVAAAAAKVAQHIIRSWSNKSASSTSARGSHAQARVLADSVAQSERAHADQKSEIPIVRDTNQLVHGAAQLIAKLQLNLDGIASTTREVMEARFDGNLERFYLRTLGQLQETGKTINVDLALHVGNDFFAASKQATALEATHLLGHPLAKIVGPLGLKLAGDLRRWLMEKLDDPQERLAGAKLGVDWLIDHFKAVSADASRLSARLAAQVIDASTELEKNASQSLSDGKKSQAQMEPLLKYLRLRFDHCAVHAAETLAGVLLSELKTTSETLIEFGRHLTHVASASAAENESADHSHLPDCASPLGSCVDTMINACLAALASEVDLKAQANYIGPNGGLFETVMSNSRVRAGLVETLQKEAALAVDRQLGQLNLINQILGEGDAGESLLGTLAKAAEPKLLSYGGAVRRLAVLPQVALDEKQTAQLREKLAGVAVVGGRNVDLALCAEAEQIPITDLAVDVIQARRDYAEFAARVHTRKDVDWTPLVDESPSIRTSTPAPAVDERQSAPLATQMV